MIFCFFAENALKTFKKYAFPMKKKNLHNQCKKQKKLAMPMQKIEKTCIAKAKNKKNAFPMEKKIALTS